MRIKTILVDDELKSLAILENKLNRLCPEIEVVGKVDQPEKAVELIEQLSPQLVFLDIAMPKMSGFDLLSRISNPSFEIIFATAFDQYAIDAIRHCAIGYLVKPIDNDDLVLMVENALVNIKEKSSTRKISTFIENFKGNTEIKKIAIPTQKGFEFVELNSIIRCEGIGGYTRLFFKNKKSLMSSFSIGYFYKLLERNSFSFCHKSHLVNLKYVERYLNSGVVELSHDHSVPVSKSRKNDFLKQLRLER